jgi:hypothetical protein
MTIVKPNTNAPIVKCALPARTAEISNTGIAATASINANPWLMLFATSSRG